MREIKAKKAITRQFKVDEWRQNFRARIREGISGNWLRWKPIECAAKGTGPCPLLLVTIRIVISPTILAARQQMPFRSVHRRAAVLVLCSKWSQRDAPRQAARLLGIRVAREPCHSRPYSHSGSESEPFVIGTICGMPPWKEKLRNLRVYDLSIGGWFWSTGEGKCRSSECASPA